MSDLDPVVREALILYAERKDDAVKRAFAVGVATALNYAKRQPDGITLKLETFGGGGWPNPYREGSDR